MKQLALPVQLRASSLFASFYPGPNGAALEQLAACGPKSKPMLLWLYGASGSGKTHLLQAVCAQATQRGLSSAYLPLGDPAIAPELLNGCESLDYVCLDDFEAVTANSAWERAIFRLYTEVEDAGGHLLIAAHSPPKTISIGLKDLQSRLAAGGLVRIQTLNDEEQTAALIFRASQLGLDMPPEVAQHLMRRLPRDMTTLCSALDLLDRVSLAAQRKLTVPFVRTVIETDESSPA